MDCVTPAPFVKRKVKPPKKKIGLLRLRARNKARRLIRETPEYKQERRERERLRRKLRRAAETPEEREYRLEKNRKDQQRQRKNLKRSMEKKHLIATESPNYKQKRLESHRLRERLRRAAETPEERENRQAKDREYKQLNIARESFENWQKRLESHRLRQRLRRAAETPEERENRLAKQREYTRRKRKELQLLSQMVLQDNPRETSKEILKRLKGDCARKRTGQDSVTPGEPENRLVEDREKEQQQRKLLYQSLLSDYLESRAQRFPFEEDLSAIFNVNNNSNYLNGMSVHYDNTSAFDLARIKKEPESLADSEKTYVLDDFSIKTEPEE